MIDSFLDCHEMFRRRYIEKIVPKKPAIHLEFGIAFHKGAEMFWREQGYDLAFAEACGYASSVDISRLNPLEREKWSQMQSYLPDMLAMYFDAHSLDEIPYQDLIEVEWSFPHLDIQLCGRIDRLSNLGVLYDIKTASAIGRTWRRDLRQQYMRKIGLGLYDWYLTQTDKSPTNILVEVCIKPWKGSAPEITEIELPEIIAYRKRFEQQLEWVVKELKHYVDNYAIAKPWPMNGGSRCVTKYGPCDYLKVCNGGDNPRNLAQFKTYEPHLEVMK